MAFDAAKFETAAVHFGQAAGSALKFFIHFAAAAAPVAAAAAPLFGADKATQDDIAKAVSASNVANQALNQVQ